MLGTHVQKAHRNQPQDQLGENIKIIQKNKSRHTNLIKNSCKVEYGPIHQSNFLQLPIQTRKQCLVWGPLCGKFELRKMDSSKRIAQGSIVHQMPHNVALGGHRWRQQIPIWWWKEEVRSKMMETPESTTQARNAPKWQALWHYKARLYARSWK